MSDDAPATPAPAKTTTAGAALVQSNAWLVAAAVAVYSTRAIWMRLNKLGKSKDKKQKVLEAVEEDVEDVEDVQDVDHIKDVEDVEDDEDVEEEFEEEWLRKFTIQAKDNQEDEEAEEECKFDESQLAVKT